MSGPGPRERLLATAADLIREHGVAGTGLTALLERSRTARGSIYQHFPRGKDDLVGAAVTAAGRDSRRAIAALEALAEPGAVIQAVMQATKDALVAEDFSRGCPVAAAATSGPEYPASVQAAAEVLTGWVDELGRVFGAVGVPAGSARPLASLVISAFEGALVQARATQSLAPLDDAAEQLSALARAQVDRSVG